MSMVVFHMTPCGDKPLGLSIAVIIVAAVTLTAQQPTFRAGVTLVTTDVIVRNDKGQFVADLTKDNFTIREDGQPQRVE